MKRKGKIFATALVSLLVCVIICFAGMKIYAGRNENTIAEGVYVDSIPLGGKTVEQASNKINSYVESLKSKKITFTAGKKSVSITLQELGFAVSENNYVEEAFNLGKTGNLIKRYKELQDVKNKNVVYNLEFTINEEKAKEFIEKKCKKYEREAKNATISRKNGSFTIKAGKTGREIQVDDTIEKIKSTLSDKWDHEDIEMELVMKEVQPECTKAQLKRVKDVLGDYSTTYASSSSSRAANLANASKLINGSVILPGEEFSTSKALSPITEENGYETAGAYLNGKVIDSVGGGVCQAATTLYNAVLEAELEVTERYNHSMIVNYVEPSMDAAISEGYKDLKFKNNTEVPIYIQSYTEGRTIFFVIYGEETRDTENRKVVYQSETLETIQPGADIETKDPTKPTSYRVVEQSAHVGYKAKLWKVVYVNGEQQSKEQVNYSSYAAEPAHVIVGSKEEKKEEENKKPDEETSKEEGKPDKENSKEDNNKEDSKEDSKEESKSDKENASEDKKNDSKTDKESSSGASSSKKDQASSTTTSSKRNSTKTSTKNN